MTGFGRGTGAARVLLLAGAVALAMVAASREAGADMGPKIRSGWYLPIGVNLGAGVHTRTHTGFLLGGEVSAVHLDADRMLWVGGYVDTIFDFGSDSFRYSIGPEIGWSVIGLDMGYMGTAKGHDYDQGIVMRLVATLGFVAIYGRWCHLFGKFEESDFGEVGVLIKAPIGIKLEPLPQKGPWVEPAPAPGPEPSTEAIQDPGPGGAGASIAPAMGGS